MTIDREFSDGKLTLKVAGRLDTNTSSELEAELKLEGLTEIVFDFSGLEYISSAGLRVLMMAQKSMASSGGKVMVARPNEMVKGILDMTGLSGVFEMA